MNDMTLEELRFQYTYGIIGGDALIEILFDRASDEEANITKYNDQLEDENWDLKQQIKQHLLDIKYLEQKLADIKGIL